MSKSFPIQESLFSRNYWVRCFRWYQTGLGVNLNLPSSFFGWSLPFCPSLLLVSWKVVPYFRPNLSDFYSLSQTTLLTNHTLHSSIPSAPAPPRVANGDFKMPQRWRERERQRQKSKIIRLNRQNNTSARAARFSVYFFWLSSLHDYDGKMPNFTFYGGCKQATVNSFLYLSELEHGPQEFGSKRVYLHLTK